MRCSSRSRSKKWIKFHFSHGVTRHASCVDGGGGYLCLKCDRNCCSVILPELFALFQLFVLNRLCVVCVSAVALLDSRHWWNTAVMCDVPFRPSAAVSQDGLGVMYRCRCHHRVPGWTPSLWARTPVWWGSPSPHGGGPCAAFKLSQGILVVLFHFFSCLAVYTVRKFMYPSNDVPDGLKYFYVSLYITLKQWDSFVQSCLCNSAACRLVSVDVVIVIVVDAPPNPRPR